jgi:hypothetical protein
LQLHLPYLELIPALQLEGQKVKFLKVCPEMRAALKLTPGSYAKVVPLHFVSLVATWSITRQRTLLKDFFIHFGHIRRPSFGLKMRSTITS